MSHIYVNKQKYISIPNRIFTVPPARSIAIFLGTDALLNDPSASECFSSPSKSTYPPSGIKCNAYFVSPLTHC